MEGLISTMSHEVGFRLCPHAPALRGRLAIGAHALVGNLALSVASARPCFGHDSPHALRRPNTIRRICKRVVHCCEQKV